MGLASSQHSTVSRGIGPALKIRGRANWGDRVFYSIVLTTALSVIVILGLLAVLLLLDAKEALSRFGLEFFTSTEWDPVFEKFGAAHFIFGTIVTSLIALVLAVPLSLGAALFLAEYAPRWLREPVAFIIELLAVIPSIIFGLWGFFVLAPVMRGAVEPFLKATVGQVPVVGALFQGTPIGRDLLTGGVILAIMILPTVMAITREVIRSVPDIQREGMIGLGATKWETISRAVLPYARGGIIGAVMLGFARAFGETMAVTMVIGNSSQAISASLLTPGYTMASAIANQFTEADSEIYFSAVVAVAVVLLLVSVVVNGCARLIVWRTAKGPIGLRF